MHACLSPAESVSPLCRAGGPDSGRAQQGSWERGPMETKQDLHSTWDWVLIQPPPGCGVSLNPHDSAEWGW